MYVEEFGLFLIYDDLSKHACALRERFPYNLEDLLVEKLIQEDSLSIHVYLKDQLSCQQPVEVSQLIVD